MEDIDQTTTKAKCPKANCNCEHFRKRILEEFYQITFRKNIYATLEELQADLVRWINRYNQERPHSGRYCYGKTPMETFLDSIELAKEKILDNAQLATA